MSSIEKAMEKLKAKEASQDRPTGAKGELKDERLDDLPSEKSSTDPKEQAQSPNNQAESSTKGGQSPTELHDEAFINKQPGEKTFIIEKPTEEEVTTGLNKSSKTQESSELKEVEEPIEERFLEKQRIRASSKRQSNYFQVDIADLERKGYVTKESEDRVLREQFRAIKRKVLQNAFGNLSKTLHFPNLCIVSSCNPHEGKTFSAINLALNIALEQDKTVLLIDADIVRPSVANRLGMQYQSGLTEYLTGKVTDIADVIFNTNIDNFKFIPAGQPHDLSTELLASQRMSNLTEELSTRYSDRIVIFDAPPLLGVNETHVLANLVGQALIVVEENKTKMADIQTAVDQLDENLAVGFVMNKSKRHWTKNFGYGYGDYGHYRSS